MFLDNGIPFLDDDITKDVKKIKKVYIKENYMEYATYEGLKKEIDELYKEYEEKNKKTNRDYIKRLNKLSKERLQGLKSLSISFIVGIASGIYVAFIDEVIDSSDAFKVMFYSIAILFFVILSMYCNNQGINKYDDEIGQYEIDLIDKILKDNYNKLKEVNNQEK